MLEARRFLVAAAGVLLLAAGTAHAGADRVVKVLPHYVDAAARHALSPSLFERDAYQALLRAHPEKRGGLRFDVRWKARRTPGQTRRLRLELISATHPRARPLVREVDLPARRTRGWARVEVDAEAARALGEWSAWRVTLWTNGRPAAELHSFLW